tara:strand:- start:1976 stop:2428 length:453 start_codon:yes stop_codon:yes gene_type:complete
LTSVQNNNKVDNVKEKKGAVMSDIPIEKLTRAFLKIKTKRGELKSEFTEQDDALNLQQEKIKYALLKHCAETGAESVRTSEGLFYRTVKQKYWTSDWESMHEFVLENKVPQLFAKSLNQTNVKQFLEENPDKLPKGLNVDSEYMISIRKN